jgi:hypothetical protein
MADQGQPRPLQMGAKGAYIVRLLMVGDSSCGKTSLVLRFDQNVFSTKFVTTIGVDYRDKMVKVRLLVLLLPIIYVSVNPASWLTLFYHPLFRFFYTCTYTQTCRLRVHPCVYNYGTLLDKRDSDH